MKYPIKKKGQDNSQLPEDNKLVICYCFDFSPYSVEGMFVPYKKPIVKKHCTLLSRFCLKIKTVNLKVLGEAG